MRTALIIVLCLVSSTLLPGQNKRESTANPSGFVLEAGDHDLTDIIERAAKFLGRNYLFHASEKAAASAQNRGRRGGAPGGTDDTTSIRLQKKLILDAIACEEVVSQLAFSRGFVIVPVDALRGIYEVISVVGPRSSILRSRFEHVTPVEVRRRSRMRVLVSTIVRLEHVSASTASQQLRPFLARSNNIGEVVVGSVGSGLLLSGFSEKVAGVLRLLEVIDVPDGETAAAGNQNGQFGYLQQQIQAHGHKMRMMESKIKQLEILLGKKQLSESKPRKSSPGKTTKKVVPSRRRR
jgi:hypothetical protein